ncbi:hypothetical protein GGX14DRAFT_388005 [Mycena pura]|uniref:Uncharacterized protein n=1 Tax=Mycena pura TaxID=153505 RepID=A0AAD6VT79_9AGAR|nr:hypothetical protein GGX14DRAFT_388005 [Mycena pura]
MNRVASTIPGKWPSTTHMPAVSAHAGMGQRGKWRYRCEYRLMACSDIHQGQVSDGGQKAQMWTHELERKRIAPPVMAHGRAQGKRTHELHRHRDARRCRDNDNTVTDGQWSAAYTTRASKRMDDADADSQASAASGGGSAVSGAASDAAVSAVRSSCCVLTRCRGALQEAVGVTFRAARQTSGDFNSVDGGCFKPPAVREYHHMTVLDFAVSAPTLCLSQVFTTYTQLATLHN